METTSTDELDTHELIQGLEQMSMINEKMLIAQMSLLMNDDCNSQMAVEYSRYKLKQASQYRIKAKKISNDAASLALYQSALVSLRSGSQKNETLLFYSGHPEHLEIIVNAGFTNEGRRSPLSLSPSSCSNLFV